MQFGRRTTLAVLASVGLHGALLLWFVSRGPAPAPATPQPAAAAFEWVELDVQPTTPAPPPAPRLVPARRPPERREAQVDSPAPQGDGAAKPVETPVEPLVDAPVEKPAGIADAAPSAPLPGAPGGEEPRPGLSPEGLFPVVPGLAGSTANRNPSLSRGETTRNGEGEAPDAQALAELKAERARRRVQGWAVADLAEARVRGGVIDGYFMDMKRALQRQAQEPGKFTEGATFVHDLVDAWRPGASQYARGGNPYAEGEVPEGNRARELQDPVANAARERPGGPEADFHMRQQAAARLREFADGRFGQGIVALVEIRQRRDGGFEAASLVRSSGNRLFDQHVLRSAPAAVALVPPPPAQGTGLHEEGIRTVWSFEGRITYFKRVKAEKLTLRDLAGAAAMQAASGLTNGIFPGGVGRFDETTGEVEIVDLTDPQFTCRVKLLRVY